MFNTPPVFSIYVSLLTLRWLDKIGGISVIEAKNTKKAKLLYNEIDRNQLIEGYSVKNDRSMMNVTFSINDLKMQNKFNEICNENGIVGIKGHRSVGGFRASIYNAMNFESVEALVEIMKELEKKI
jgi:phosphoserine aminotransferase